MQKNISSLSPYLLAFFVLVLNIPQAFSQPSKDKSSNGLENPITAAYLQKNLPKKSPKLILTPALEATIRQKLKSDPYVIAYYKNLEKEAGEIMKKPLVKHELEGLGYWRYRATWYTG